MGAIVITLFMLAFLVAEHNLAYVLYDSLERRWSKEYVRRLRVSLKIDVLLIISYIWAITLSSEFRYFSNQLFWLLTLLMVGFGIWTLLGWRVKE